MDVIVTPTAQKELDAIQEDLVDDIGVQAAENFITNIMGRTLRLLSTGYLTARHPYTNVPDVYRYVPHKSYQVFYRHGQGKAYIMHVIHTKRDVQSLFTSGIPTE